MKETRICIIGGGSRLWAIQFFKDLAYNKMTHGTVVLHDIDHKAAMNNVAVGEQTFRVNYSEGRFKFIAEDNLEKALEGVYSSEIFQKLSDPATGLFKEGPAYIYSYLKDELGKGKI